MPFVYCFSICVYVPVMHCCIHVSVADCTVYPRSLFKCMCVSLYSHWLSRCLCVPFWAVSVFVCASHQLFQSVAVCIPLRLISVLCVPPWIVTVSVYSHLDCFSVCVFLMDCFIMCIPFGLFQCLCVSLVVRFNVCVYPLWTVSVSVWIPCPF